MQTRNRTDLFLKLNSWPAPQALHPLCLETQTGGLGESWTVALNVVAGLLETAEVLTWFPEGRLIKDRGRGGFIDPHQQTVCY